MYDKMRVIMRAVCDLHVCIFKYPVRFVLAIFLLFAAIGVSLAIPYLFALFINSLVWYDEANQAFHGKDPSFLTLVLFGIGIVVAYLVSGLFHWSSHYARSSLAHKVGFDLRNRIYDHLQRMDHEFYDHNPASDVTSKFFNDIPTLRQYVQDTEFSIIEAGVRVLATITVILIIDPLLLGIGTVFIFLYSIHMVAVQGRLRNLWLQVRELNIKVTSTAHSSIIRMRLIKASGSEDHERRIFKERLDEFYYARLRLNKTYAFSKAWLNMASILTLGSLMVYGLYEVSTSRISPGEVAMLVIMSRQMAVPLRTVAPILSHLMRTGIAGDHFFGALRTESKIKDQAFDSELTMNSRALGHIEFRDVSFKYGNKQVLSNISFKASAGDKILITGASGSGKSTIAHLIPRFYEITGGAILIDGVDIHDLPLEFLRNNVGIVEQESFLFHIPIADNIRYGKSSAPWDRVIKSSKAAEIHEFIKSLPDGYDTSVGERGIMLSGGQRQRVALARAFLMDYPILVVDDPISGVDVETGRAISDTIRGLDSTVIIITHQPEYFSYADIKLHLSDGALVPVTGPQKLSELSELKAELQAEVPELPEMPELASTEHIRDTA